jgi:hypothetical protein
LYFFILFSLLCFLSLYLPTLYPHFLYMPKLIDYPRTSYSGAWEVAEVVDDTGGKCALETCARKLNRKVSGSFKAIVGSAVKFGLLTSKREMLTTTTLFRRIKHAYDKQEELVFHREAFLTPPLFTQLCRKFRSRELPVAMLDVLLIREFDVEEINAQGVSKAFTDGARMVGLLDEHNVMADIDQLAAQQGPRRELASQPLATNVFRQVPIATTPDEELIDDDDTDHSDDSGAAPAPEIATAPSASTTPNQSQRLAPTARTAPAATADAIANLFGLAGSAPTPTNPPSSAAGTLPRAATPPPAAEPTRLSSINTPAVQATSGTTSISGTSLFRIELTGPGINTQLEVTDVEDLALVRALLDKIERQLKR